jgi:EAL domain-containing protein (putative c-di-GMP-specific phosphodiesterase class I)
MTGVLSWGNVTRMLGEHVFQLQIEITESVLLGRASIADELLQWVRSLGVRVAFDDFGTGYSSLSYLQLYKIDTLKIDASFIWKMSAHPGNVEIVRATVALGQAFGIAVVAEGVESEEQRQLLLECGAQSGQGYLFSKPVNAQEIAALVQPGPNLAART